MKWRSNDDFACVAMCNGGAEPEETEHHWYFFNARFEIKPFGTGRSSISRRGLRPCVFLESTNTRSHRPHYDFLSWRYCLIRLLVELSCTGFGSAGLSNSGRIRFARTFPSSTPHWSNESMSQIAP